LYLLWVVVLMLPVSLHLSSAVLGVGDGEFYLWLGWRMGELLSHGDWPLDIPDVVVPFGYDVALGDGIGPYLVLGVTNVLLGPVLALNLVIAAALFLNALAGRHLAKACGATSRVTWIVTALALASAPSLLVRAPVHFYFLFAFVSALVVAEAVLFARGEAPIRILRVGLLLGATYYVSFYWFVSTALAYATIIGVAALRRRAVVRPGLRFVGCVGICAVLVLPLVVPRVDVDRREARTSDDGYNAYVRYRATEATVYAADLLAVVTPPPGTRFQPPGVGAVQDSFVGNRYEATIFPGFLMLLATICFGFVRSPLRVPVLVATAVLWVLSLGPALRVGGDLVIADAGGPTRVLPARLLQELPGLEALRTPSRIAFALPILTAVALAVVFDDLWRRVRQRGRAALVASAGVLLVANLIRPETTPRDPFPALAPTLEAMAARPAAASEAALEVPFDPAGTVGTIRLQMTHRRPMLGFHAQWAALPWFSDLSGYKTSAALAAIRCIPGKLQFATTDFPTAPNPSGTELEELRRAFGVRYLLVNESSLDNAVCDARRDAIEEAIAPARELAHGNGWRILEIPS
jgi:hypothetical protein